MPPLPVVTDAWQVVVKGTAPSTQTWENVYGFVAGSTTLTQAAADDLSAAIAGCYADLLLSNQYHGDSVTVTDLRTLDGPQFDSTEGWPVTGPQESQPLPLQTAALVSWGTSTRGRSFRGRTYIAGFTEGGSDGAHMLSGDHGSLVDFATEMLTIDPPLGIISRYSGVDPDTGLPIPRDPGIISNVTSFVAHDLWKTQRRRAPRG